MGRILMSPVVGMAFPIYILNQLLHVNYAMSSFSGFDKPLCSNPSKFFLYHFTFLPLSLGARGLKAPLPMFWPAITFAVSHKRFSQQNMIFKYFYLTELQKLREQLCQLDAQAASNTSPWQSVCPCPTTFSYYLGYI